MNGTFWQRLTTGVTRLRQRADWAGFVGSDWAAHIMDAAVTDRFHAKQGRSTGRWILEADDGRRLAVYLKRHYELPWFDRLRALIRPGGAWSPAMQEWQHLEWASAQGLLVPSPVAAGEFVGPWGRLQSFLAVEELAGMLPLHEAIPAAQTALDAETFLRWKATLTAEVARQSRELHDRACFHKDLYLCHFYIPADDTTRLPTWRGRVYMIDLHRLGHHPWTRFLWQVKDLAQLLYSSDVAGVTARDRLRFWKVYLGAGRRQGMGRLLRRCILGKWRRYRRHNEPAESDRGGLVNSAHGLRASEETSGCGISPPLPHGRRERNGREQRNGA